MATKKRAGKRAEAKPEEKPEANQLPEYLRDLRDQTGEVTDISLLKPHPRNYQGHPEDQLLHLEASLRQHGQYRNVVAARDWTLLAGHGIAEAARRIGMKQLIVKRLEIDPESPQALKVLAADNELGRFAERDDRALSELLKQIRESDAGKLLGTGYDDQNLVALLMVTRPASEIGSMDEAAEWIGMPEYEAGGNPIRLTITFKNVEDRARFVEETKLTIDKVIGVQSWSTRWPFTEWEDASSVRFEAEDEEKAVAE